MSGEGRSGMLSRFDEMLATLDQAAAGNVILLHGCCHNPTGVDLSENQWRAIADVVASRKLIPFIDIAYLGFANGLEADAFGVRHFIEQVPEMIVSSSCSKNFALYRDRVGALSFVANEFEATERSCSLTPKLPLGRIRIRLPTGYVRLHCRSRIPALGCRERLVQLTIQDFRPGQHDFQAVLHLSLEV